MAKRLIPLFPLDVVLFPGMVLPLRIFEPRYRLMIRRCLENDRTFGVALIRQGEEVGLGAEPCLVGTLAEINAVEMLDDGQMMLVGVGLRRFKIEQLVDSEPYLQAEVSILEEGDPATPVAEGLMADSLKALGAFMRAMKALGNTQMALPAEPLSAIDLSYLVSALLPVPNVEKQTLLEVVDVQSRLLDALAILERENLEIEEFLSESRARGDYFYRGFRRSLN